MKPNIVLITVDQMRRDCLGILNDNQCETPYLDHMKRDGVIFTKAYSAVPSCIAARAALLTGLSQQKHKRVGYEDEVPWSYEVTLPGELTKAGYHTQCVGKMHVYPTRNLCGFHNVVLHDGYLEHNRNSRKPYEESWQQADDYTNWAQSQLGHKFDIIDHGLECNSWVARPWPYAEYLHPTNWVVSESIDFLRRRDTTKPFFLMTSFVRPHSPLDPPEYYFNQYLNKEIQLPPVGDWAEAEEEAGLDINCKKGKLNPELLKRARAAYYASITHIDHQIGRLLQMLREYNVLENTVVIFTSDHGDMLGEHNKFRKALPYEGSSGVPLVFYDPGNLLNMGKNMVCDELIELRDIMPTILDIAEIDLPESVDGLSILPSLSNHTVLRDFLHGEHSFGEASNHFIVSKNYKYIWYSQTGEEQFFHLKEDPHELKNLINESYYENEISRMRLQLINELSGRQEGYIEDGHLIVGKNTVNVLGDLP